MPQSLEEQSKFKPPPRTMVEPSGQHPTSPFEERSKFKQTPKGRYLGWRVGRNSERCSGDRCAVRCTAQKKSAHTREGYRVGRMRQKLQALVSLTEYIFPPGHRKINL